jgi:hypothetical protein
MLRFLPLILLAACGESSSSPVDTPEAEIAPDVEVAPEVEVDAAPDWSVCPPDRLFCTSPTESARCNPAGDGYGDPIACTGATACEPATGLCRPTVCEPDALNCLDLERYQICASDGSGYGAAERCEEPLFCASGKCRACTENNVECLSDTTYRRCAEDASAWSDTLTCPLDFRCTTAGEPGCKRCDLELTCVNDGKSRARCTSGEVQWQQDIDCAPGESCVEGRCRMCEANRSECLSETTFRQCADTGAFWSAAQACPEGQACLPTAAGDDAGRCLPYECSARVLLLVDYSGSMGPHWDQVRRSVALLVADNPDLRFGLKSFPDVDEWGCGVSETLEIPFSDDNAATFDAWFINNPPSGATPLAAGVEAVRLNAATIFGALGGTVIVLSDGEDSCYGSSGGPEIRFALATSTAGLYEQHKVRTFAIGYSFGGDPGELDVIANNGGTGLRSHIPAGSESELTQVFEDVIDKVKFCSPE